MNWNELLDCANNMANFFSFKHAINYYFTAISDYVPE